MSVTLVCYLDDQFYAFGLLIACILVVALIGVLIVFIFLFATLDINAIRVTVEGDLFQKDWSLLY